jgi:hypothetical protein
LIMVLVLLLIVIIILWFLLSYFRVDFRASLNSADPAHAVQIKIKSTLAIIDKEYSWNFEDLLSLLPGFKVENENLKPTPRLREIPRRIRNKLNAYKSNATLVRRILNWLVLEKFEWKTRSGREDAMDTALLTGLFWCLKGILVSAISSKIKMEKLILNSEPDFSQPGINSCLVCILKIRIVHIMIIASLIFALKVRGYLHGYSTEREVCASD